MKGYLDRVANGSAVMGAEVVPCVGDPAIDSERASVGDGIGHDSLLESNMEVQVVHFMEKVLADDVFELEMTDEHAR